VCGVVVEGCDYIGCFGRSAEVDAVVVSGLGVWVFFGLGVCVWCGGVCGGLRRCLILVFYLAGLVVLWSFCLVCVTGAFVWFGAGFYWRLWFFALVLLFMFGWFFWICFFFCLELLVFVGVWSEVFG